MRSVTTDDTFGLFERSCAFRPQSKGDKSTMTFNNILNSGYCLESIDILRIVPQQLLLFFQQLDESMRKRGKLEGYISC